MHERRRAPRVIEAWTRGPVGRGSGLHRPNVLHNVLAMLLVGVVLTGCRAADPDASERLEEPVQYAGEPTSATTSSAPAEPIRAEDLLTAKIPALCQHDEGHLVDGQLPGLGHNEGYAAISTGLTTDEYSSGIPPVFVDLTRDGVDDAVAVLSCSAGGVSWPDTILFYGPHTTFLGQVDLVYTTSAEHATVESLTAESDGVRVSWTTYEGAGFDVKYWTAMLHWDGVTLTADDLTQTG
jgi:hypothetical protein